MLSEGKVPIDKRRLLIEGLVSPKTLEQIRTAPLMPGVSRAKRLVCAAATRWRRYSSEELNLRSDLIVDLRAAEGRAA
jgi:hypothetical protein